MYSILKGKIKPMLIWVALLGVSNTILNSLLLFFFSNTLSDKPVFFIKNGVWFIFIPILCVTLWVNKLFQTHITKMTFNILFDFELELIQKLRFAAFESFQKFGTEKIYTVLNDIRVLGNLPGIIVGTFNAAVMVFCCIIYFLFVYFYAALILLALIATLLILHVKYNLIILRKLREVRAFQDSFYIMINDLLYGFKEIKMSAAKNVNFYRNHVIPNRTKGKMLAINSATDYLANELTGRFSWFVVIGIVIYLFPSLLIVNETQTKIFLMVILYLMGPVNLLFSMIPYYGAAKISLERLNKFDETFHSIEQEKKMINDGYIPEAFESLHFEGVCFEYTGADNQKRFTLGPIDYRIAKGDIVFVTGGNGSGKSTFFNILTGLYMPTAGSIYFNGKKLQVEDYQHYRNQIAAIFSIPHLFSENYEDFEWNDMREDVLELVDKFSLRGILDINNTDIQAMSRGQQKRLLLIHALLENKPIIALDEWAAEQDPIFRDHFYDKLLLELRLRDKTIIAITHDDKYFDKADTVLKFEFGKMTHISDRKNNFAGNFR